MSHPQQLDFVSQVRTMFPHYFHRKRVLEVGSLNVNGTVRGFFTECDYLGIDIQPGPGVDRVCDVKDMPVDDLYDVVISCEMLEHELFRRARLYDMTLLCKKGGLLIVTCAGHGRAEHGTPATGEAWALPHYHNVELYDAAAVVTEIDFHRIHMEYDGDVHDLRLWAIRR